MLAVISGLSLGICLVLVIYTFILKRSDDSGVMYSYDSDNRLQSILPMNKNTQVVKLKEV